MNNFKRLINKAFITYRYFSEINITLSIDLFTADTWSTWEMEVFVVAWIHLAGKHLESTLCMGFCHETGAPEWMSAYEWMSSYMNGWVN
jgi:hypothetical protein